MNLVKSLQETWKSLVDYTPFILTIGGQVLYLIVIVIGVLLLTLLNLILSLLGIRASQ